jgi:hypothetical protein
MKLARRRLDRINPYNVAGAEPFHGRFTGNLLRHFKKNFNGGISVEKAIGLRKNSFHAGVAASNGVQ